MLPRLSVIRCFQYSPTRALTLASRAGSAATEDAAGLTAAAGLAAGFACSFAACARSGETRASDAPTARRTIRSVFKAGGSFRAGRDAAAHCRRAETVDPRVE